MCTRLDQTSNQCSSVRCAESTTDLGQTCGVAADDTSGSVIELTAASPSRLVAGERVVLQEVKRVT